MEYWLIKRKMANSDELMKVRLDTMTDELVLVRSDPKMYGEGFNYVTEYHRKVLNGGVVIYYMYNPPTNYSSITPREVSIFEIVHEVINNQGRCSYISQEAKRLAALVKEQKMKRLSVQKMNKIFFAELKDPRDMTVYDIWIRLVSSNYMIGNSGEVEFSNIYK